MTTIPLPKSIATVWISGTLAEKMEAAAAIGFGGVEIFENDLLTFEGSARQHRRSDALRRLKPNCLRKRNALVQTADR